MTSTALEVPTSQWDALALLEGAGALTPTSLNLSDPNMPYERYEALLRCFGALERSNRWWIGDAINLGATLYGEEHAQAIEATVGERYNLAERVTGLSHQTLLNVSSVCGRVSRDRRRPELPFSIHAIVASLEPDEQTVWLQKAIDEEMSVSDLREAIRNAKSPAGTAAATTAVSSGGVTIGERLQEVAWLIWRSGQSTSDGSVLIPLDVWSQLGAALGEGE